MRKKFSEKVFFRSEFEETGANEKMGKIPLDCAYSLEDIKFNSKEIKFQNLFHFDFFL